MIRLAPKSNLGLKEILESTFLSTTKPRRKALVGVMKSMLSAKDLASPLNVTAISLGFDNNGELWIFIHEKDSQVLTTLGDQHNG